MSDETNTKSNQITFYKILLIENEHYYAIKCFVSLASVWHNWFEFHFYNFFFFKFDGMRKSANRANARLQNRLTFYL